MVKNAQTSYDHDTHYDAFSGPSLASRHSSSSETIYHSCTSLLGSSSPLNRRPVHLSAPPSNFHLSLPMMSQELRKLEDTHFPPYSGPRHDYYYDANDDVCKDDSFAERFDPDIPVLPIPALTVSRSGWIPRPNSKTGRTYPSLVRNRTHLATRFITPSRSSPPVVATDSDFDPLTGNPAGHASADHNDEDTSAYAATPSSLLRSSSISPRSGSDSSSLASLSNSVTYLPLSPARLNKIKQKLIYDYSSDSNSTSNRRRHSRSAAVSRSGTRRDTSITGDDDNSVSEWFGTPYIGPQRLTTKRTREDPSEDLESSQPLKKYRFSSYTLSRDSIRSNETASIAPRVYGHPRSSYAYFSRKPASLRRAQSLRSEAESFASSDSTKDRATLGDEYQTRTAFSRTPSPSSPYCPPTIPTTPASVLLPLLPLHLPPPSPLRIPSPLPIIAPPTKFTLFPRAPLSKEDAAEMRLTVLVEKEQKGRLRAGLEVQEHWAGEGSGDNIDEDEECSEDEEEEEDVVEDEGNEFENEYGEWITWAPHEKPGDAESVQDTEALIQNYKCDLVLGIPNDLRREALEWILDVLPPMPDYTNPSSSRYKPDPDLLDQLLTSPETRFHAAYMFIQYFFLVVGGGSSNDIGDVEEGMEIKVGRKKCGEVGEETYGTLYNEGLESITWDIAIGCLALSVKYNRDVLPPLYPVSASSFLSLPPSHHTMSYADLEAAQRDILSAFEYNLGDLRMPQGFIDEVWESLPTLRYLLRLDGAWEKVERGTWTRLLRAVLEPDILRFPVSVLTVVVLSDTIVAVLVGELRRQYSLYSNVGMEDVAAVLERKWIIQATLASTDVLKDVQDILGINDNEMKECKRWWKKSEGIRVCY